MSSNKRAKQKPKRGKTKAPKGPIYPFEHRRSNKKAGKRRYKKNLSASTASSKPTKPIHGAQKAKRRKKFNPSSAAFAKKARKLGIPLPAIGQDLVAEQRKWYKRLYDSGFKDLENVNLKTGEGHDNDILRGATTRARQWRPEKAQYYRLLRAYVAHAQIKHPMDKYIMRQLAEGVAYRKILKVCKDQFKLRKSLYWFFYHCEVLVKRCMKWHTRHREGLLNPAYQDSWASDALLADIGLQDAYLGLPMDVDLGKLQTKDWYKKYGN